MTDDKYTCPEVRQYEFEPEKGFAESGFGATNQPGADPFELFFGDFEF